MELRVEVSGDKPAILLTRDSVADISCGGVKCDLDLDVPVGTRVDVCFPGMPDAVLPPELTNGHVVRSESLGGVPDQLVIAFARPLEHLDIERLSTTHPAAAARHPEPQEQLGSQHGSVSDAGDRQLSVTLVNEATSHSANIWR